MPEKAIRPVTDYLQLGQFHFVSDAFGLNEYCLGFFKNLRDEDNQRRRKKAYKKIVVAYLDLNLAPFRLWARFVRQWVAH